MSLSVLTASQTKALIPKAVVLLPGQQMMRNGRPLHFQEYVAYGDNAQAAKKAAARKARRFRYVYPAVAGPVPDDQGKFTCSVTGAH